MESLHVPDAAQLEAALVQLYSPTSDSTQTAAKDQIEAIFQNIKRSPHGWNAAAGYSFLLLFWLLPTILAI
jgi:hypothetical protein